VDLADLVSPAGLMLRPLLHFFLIGSLLFGARSLFTPRVAEGPELTVYVSPKASDAEVEQEIREAILLSEARRYGWDRTDPVVFEHLVRNMRFVEPDSPDDDLTLYKRAIEMNMHAHDPIVRARLLYRATEALGTVPESDLPTRDDLELHLRTHPERFERPRRVRFYHVFLSGSKRGDALGADAARMREQLSELGDAAPEGLGDPLPGLRSVQVATLASLAADYGGDLSRVAADARLGVWRGPVSSVYGVHFLKVVGEEPAYVPPLDAISAEVRADRLREFREELGKERMMALRSAYTVHVERQP
jgi:hypothetical protein